MHTLLSALLLSLFSLTSFSQDWESAFSLTELNEANTAQTVSYLNQDEKELLQLINLVRLYPQQFRDEVYLPYLKENSISRNSYTQSLLVTLSQMRAQVAYKPHAVLTQIAEAQARYLGQSGKATHNNARGQSPAERIRERISSEITAENIDLGRDQPLDILMSLLIDDGIIGTGHRVNLLHQELTHIGIAIGSHKKYGTVCVQDFGVITD